MNRNLCELGVPAVQSSCFFRLRFCRRWRGIQDSFHHEVVHEHSARLQVMKMEEFPLHQDLHGPQIFKGGREEHEGLLEKNLTLGGAEGAEVKVFLTLQDQRLCGAMRPRL